MSYSILITVVVAFYGCLWFFDSFFKSCLHYPYFAFLEGTGLKIGIFNFTWTTTAFNRQIFICSKKLSRILRKWFHIGCLFTLFLFLPFALWTLASLVFENLHFHVIEKRNAPEVRALLPGVNIPASDFWVYFLAVGICTIFHELGHAMAAADEGIPLMNVKFQVFTIMPIAMVQLNKDSLNSLTIMQQLKIVCAGVWHNIALAFVAMLLFFSSPILFSLAYETDLGVRVAAFNNDSPLSGERGLKVNDVITSINGCTVKNLKDWFHCLHSAYDRIGVCTSEDLLTLHDSKILADASQCCQNDLYSICFEFALPKDLAEMPLPTQYICMRPRDMIKNKLIKCLEQKSYWCPQSRHCLKPLLNNSTYFMVIEKKDVTPVLYLGLPYDLYKTVIVDQYFPRNRIFSLISPAELEKFLKYTFIFSLGIGFLNVIPCYGTDGHHIARNLIQLLATATNKTEDFVNFSTILTVFTGTMITGPVLIYLFYKAICENM